MVRRATSLLRRALVAVGLVLVALVATAAPAAAHTALRSSNPSAGAVVAAVDRLELRFTEPIEAAGSHLYVEDTAGFIELPKAAPVDGDLASLTVALPPLGDGTYAVTWHVVAADGDPVQGTFSFTIDPAAAGAATTTPVTLADPAADFTPDTSLAISLDEFGVVQEVPDAAHGHGAGALTEAAARMVLDLGIAVLVGGFVFLAVVWPKGAGVLRARQLLLSAVLLAGLGSFELTAFQYSTVKGIGITEGLLPWHQVDALDLRFGRIAAVRLVLLVAAWVLVTQLGSGGAPRVRSTRWRAQAAFVGVALLQTLVLLGHAQSSGVLAQGARLLHVLGISTWIGGLVVLVGVVLPRGRARELAVVLPRFSIMATGAVAALTASGVVLSVVLVGSLSDLVGTGYGRLLLAKVAVVGLAVAAAARSRRLVHATWPDEPAPALTPSSAGDHHGALLLTDERDVRAVLAPLARWVAIEVGLLAGVLVLTTLLLTRVPPG
jgi:copper transport protein